VRGRLWTAHSNNEPRALTPTAINTKAALATVQPPVSAGAVAPAAVVTCRAP
jgi:hypothetical protein